MAASSSLDSLCCSAVVALGSRGRHERRRDRSQEIKHVKHERKHVRIQTKCPQPNLARRRFQPPSNVVSSAVGRGAEKQRARTYCDLSRFIDVLAVSWDWNAFKLSIFFAPRPFAECFRFYHKNFY